MTASRPIMKELTWPADGLERVPNCPLCGSSSRSLLHEGLSDRVFFVAPGQWTLWRCEQCRSAWLDPRPNQATIGLAYREYYTHEEDGRPTPRTRLQNIRATLGNGYRNHRYGTHYSPSSKLGRPLAALVPPLRWPVDVAYRFIPRPVAGQPMRVLDIGCGNGAWLAMAREAGWQVGGVEPDPVSREQAHARGFDVRESIAGWLAEPESFNYVTLSHVIEHVHDPLQLLRDAYELLCSGGGIYIDTPNIDALGHAIHGRHWRGLEPPRHLVLFNRASLSKAAFDTGFRSIRHPFRLYPLHLMSEQSRRIAAGLAPYSLETSANMAGPMSLTLRFRAMLARRRSEFLTLTATKPR